jgi:Protein of unknown function (DUF3052)
VPGGSASPPSSSTTSPAAGYSGTPLTRKLGIRPGARVVLSGAPPGAEALLDGLPDGVRLARRLAGAVDVIVLFADRRADLARRLPVAQAAMRPDGGLWVAWPKRASGVPTDITEDVVREMGLAAGLVDNKVCAIDATWSGLRLVVRVRDRPARTSPERQERR